MENINLTKELEIFTNEVIEEVKTSFEKNKYYKPCFFILAHDSGKRQIHVIDGLNELFESDQGKSIASQLIIEMCKKVKGISVGFASEAYVSNYDLKTFKGDNLSENLIKNESIVIIFETFKDVSFNYYNIIKDNSDEVIALEEYPLSSWEPKKDIKGKFTNLIIENYE